MISSDSSNTELKYHSRIVSTLSPLILKQPTGAYYSYSQIKLEAKLLPLNTTPSFRSRFSPSPNSSNVKNTFSTWAISSPSSSMSFMILAFPSASTIFAIYTLMQTASYLASAVRTPVADFSELFRTNLVCTIDLNSGTGESKSSLEMRCCAHCFQKIHPATDCYAALKIARVDSIPLQ